jgi:hypothetical protein
MPFPERPRTPPPQLILINEPLPGSSVAEMLEPEKKKYKLLNLFSSVVSFILPKNETANDEDIKKEAAAAEAAAKAAAEAAAAAAAAVEDTKNKTLDTKILSEKIKCIEYSIKKLELDMRLTNEDSIGTDEFENVLLEITNLSNNVSGTCIQRITIEEFQENARMKRKMNSYAAMIKMASFICPVLAIANKSALSQLSSVNITSEHIQNTKSVCSTIIMTMLNFASVENGEILETASNAVDLAGKGHEVGVIDAVYNAVGVTTSVGGIIGDKIKEVYNDYIITKNTTNDTTFYAANAIRNYFKIATKSQQIVATASLILLIMFTLLNVVEGKFEGLIGMIKKESTGLFEITNTTLSISNGGKRTKSKAKTTKPPKTPTKPPKTPTKPPKTPKAVPKKKK